MRKTYKKGALAAAALILVAAGISALIVEPKAIADNAPRIFNRNKTKVAKGNSTVQKPSGQKKTNSGSSHAAPVVKTASAALGQAAPAAGPRSSDCTVAAPLHTTLAGAQAPTLQKLAEYEKVCGSAIATGSSFFAPTPRNTAEAQEHAYDMAVRLREFSKFGITPVIFLEPTYPGGILDFNAYKAGAFDEGLDAYFAAIKAHGISDGAMGRWVLFPEGNIPVWNNIDPATYAANVTKTAHYIKKHFPAAHVSLLLDSMTYPTGGSWSGGQYKTLAPYIQSIPKGLISSFGLQGFPWMPPANEGGPALSDPSVYLRTDIAAEAARILGVQDVWLNTGSMSVAHARSAATKVSLSPATRQTMLDGSLKQATKLKSQGFKTSIHLFAEDKSQVAEGINWSYWPTGQPGIGDHAAVFKTFVHDARTASIELWIFDTK
jgi:hypothetical protein